MFGTGLFGTRLFGTGGTSSSQAPLVNAGIDHILLPGKNSTVLTGSVSDPDNDSLIYMWTKESGPNNASITDPFNISTSVTGLVAGNYVFRLIVDDGTNIVYDEVLITVLKNKKKGVGSIYIKKRGIIL